MNKSLIQPIIKIKEVLSKTYTSGVLFALVIIFASLGFWIDYMSIIKSTNQMPIAEFTEHLHNKEAEAVETLKYLYEAELDQVTSTRQVSRKELAIIEKAKKQDIEYYVYNDSIMTFWTGNEINIGSINDFPQENEFYYRAANFHCIGIRVDITNSTFIALIKLKTAYYHEEMKHEVFLKGFYMPNHVNIVSETDFGPKIPIYKQDGMTPLLMLEKVPYREPNKTLKKICGLCWLLCGISICFFIRKLYISQKRNEITTTRYNVWVGTLLLVMLIGAFYKQPFYLFNSPLFSTAYYNSEYASSLGVVIVYTFVISLFYFLVLRKKVSFDRENNTPATISDFIKSVLLQLLAVILTISLYFITQHFINNSKINIAVAFIQDINVPSIIALIIIIAWHCILAAVCQRIIISSIKPFSTIGRVIVSVISITTILFITFYSNLDISKFYGIIIAILFSYMSCAYIHKKMPSMINLIVYAFMVINLAVGAAINICEIRNDKKMQILSKEISTGKLIQKDDFAEKYIAKAAEHARHDPILRTYLKDTVNRSNEAEEYIRAKYLKGYWERYDVDVQIVPKMGPLNIRIDLEGNTKQYFPQKSLFANSFKIQQYTDFYLNEDIHLPVSYIGKLKGAPERNNEIVFLLYPSKKYRQIDSRTLNGKYANYASNFEDISIAKYVDRKLQQWTGKYPFPPSFDNFQYSNANSYFYKSGAHNLYITKFDEQGGSIVVANLAKAPTLHIMLMSTAFGLFFFALMIFQLLKFVRQRKMRTSLFSKSQCWMMVMMSGLFFIMIIFSGKFFSMQYSMQQKMKMTQRTMGVQSYLIQQIGYRNDIKCESPEWYHELLQNFGNVMKAGLILYDKNGVQYAASNQDLFNYGTKRINNVNHKMLPEARFPNLDNDGFPYIETIANKEYYSIYKEVVNEYNVHLGFVQLIDTVTGTSDKTPALNFVIITMDIFLGIIMIALACIWFINKKIGSPLEELTSKMRDFDLRSDNIKITTSNSNDEIGLLVSRYNMLVDKLKDAAKKLAKNERDAAWREMARSIAHEIKNPLTPIKLNIQLSQKTFEEDPEKFAKIFPRTCERVIEQIDNLARIATDFSDFAKVSAANHAKLDILHSLRNVTELYTINPEGVIIQNEIPYNESAFIMGEEKQLYQIFNNLIKNAIQAIPDDNIGIITITSEKTDTKIRIAIQDNGCGISADNIEKIFQPNFTTKNSGMGLGLAISKSIIENSGGMIWVESTIGEGTTFFVEMPLITTSNTNKQI